MEVSKDLPIVWTNCFNNIQMKLKAKANTERYLFRTNEDGYFTVSRAVKNELGIKDAFTMYDKNGCIIDYTEDFRHLKNNDCIYICPAKHEFDYQSLLNMYSKKKKLGEGGYGTVYLLKHKLTSEKIAAKFVDISEYLKKADDIQKALKEAQHLLTLDHRNIVKLESVFILKKQIVIFMEYVEGGELKELIAARATPYLEKDAKKIMKILISAIEYIHSHNIVHRDLKLENILLSVKNDYLSMRIIDFGISGLLSTVGGGEKVQAGTLMYSPPEVITKKKLNSDPKIDIWACGVIMYVLLTKQYPFNCDNEYKTFMSILKDKIKFPKTSMLSKEARHLIKCMLDRDYITRYTIEEIKIHPWISEEFEDEEGNERK